MSEPRNVLLRVMQDENIVGRRRQRIEDAADGMVRAALAAPEPRVMPRDVLREAQPYIAPLLRETLTPTQQENFEAWVAHFEGRLRETPPEIVEAIRRALAAVPSESEPELGGHRVDVGLPVWSEETRAVPSESDAGLDVERLAAALERHWVPPLGIGDTWQEKAERIAAEYARLARP